MASAVANKCMELMEKEKTEDFEALNVRARALKDLIELANGNVKLGTVALSYEEFLQAKKNYSMAKEVYQNVIEGAIELKENGNPYLGAANMNLEGLMMRAMCS